MKEKFLNTYVNNLTMDEAIDGILQIIPEKKSAYLVAINVDVVMKMETDTELREISDQADFTLIDGKPLMWIASWYGRPFKEKISGSDLMPALCRAAAAQEMSIFVFGGMGDVPRLACENLARENPGLRIAGYYSPPKGFEQDPAEEQKIVSMINDAQPDIVFACLGCPKQEKWIRRNRTLIRTGIFLCAGASVDFAAGNVRRAPKWMSDHGLEWFYRFTKEPTRLFRRYFIDDTKILKLAVKYRPKR